MVCEFPRTAMNCYKLSGLKQQMCSLTDLEARSPDLWVSTTDLVDL